MQKRLYVVSALTTALLVGLPNSAVAQSTPSEFAELSMQQLLNIELEPSNADAGDSLWQFQYQLRHAEFDGYLHGDSDLTLDEVLWSGPQEVRTPNNYPIVPTVIIQNVHLFSISREFSDNWSVSLSVPYISQETDHISIVPDYETFLLKTDGVGDVVVKGNYRFSSSDTGGWSVGAGLSLPTGSIDEVGDTPREAGDQPLPYTMQLGSGTFDIPFDVAYHHSGAHHYSVSLSAMLRTGRNDENYRLGHSIAANARYYWFENSEIQVFAGLGASYRQAISGRDDRLLVDGPFPFPASITNPDNYGGKKLSTTLGVLWNINEQFKLSVDFTKPIYQHLNGPQPQETWSSSLSLVTRIE